jgi:hypothetical protein
MIMTLTDVETGCKVHDDVPRSRSRWRSAFQQADQQVGASPSASEGPFGGCMIHGCGSCDLK